MAYLESTTLVVLIVAVLVLLPLGVIAGLFYQRQVTTRRLGDVAQHSRRVIEESERTAEAHLKDAAIEAKEVVYRARTELEQEIRERQKEIQALERRLSQKEEQVTRRLDQFDRRDRDYHTREESLRDAGAGPEGDRGPASRRWSTSSAGKLERIAGLTAEEAKRQLLAQMEIEARREAAADRHAARGGGARGSRSARRARCSRPPSSGSPRTTRWRPRCPSWTCRRTT